MAVEDWIDDVARLWGTIRAGTGNVRSYRCFTKTDFPEAITEFPAAVSFITNVRFMGGSDGGPHILYWEGQTEFYIAAGTSKANVPEVMRYFDRILRASVLYRKLNNKNIGEFALIKADQGLAIEGPALLNYGGEQMHMGLVVHWRVKEVMTGVTVGL